MNRATIFATLMLLAACGTPTEGPDAGSTGTLPDGGTDTTKPDGGDTRLPDGGPAVDACQTEDATEVCTGSTDGSCDPGVRTCRGGVWSACEGRLQPAPGVCDFPNCAGGLNDGCGCTVGSSQECYSGAAGTLGHGPCVRGFQQCVATAAGSEWGPCRGEVVPAAVDDCSGRQLDCNDTTPACTCTAGATQDCGGVSGGSCILGTQTCTGGTWGACAGGVQPVPGDCAHASCLGAGVPNPGCECVIGATEACYTGVFGTDTTGTCHAGTRTCDTLGRWGKCFGEERPNPSCDAESCTGSPLASCL